MLQKHSWLPPAAPLLGLKVTALHLDMDHKSSVLLLCVTRPVQDCLAVKYVGVITDAAWRSGTVGLAEKKKTPQICPLMLWIRLVFEKTKWPHRHGKTVHALNYSSHRPPPECWMCWVQFSRRGHCLLAPTSTDSVVWLIMPEKKKCSFTIMPLHHQEVVNVQMPVFAQVDVRIRLFRSCSTFPSKNKYGRGAAIER